MKMVTPSSSRKLPITTATNKSAIFLLSFAVKIYPNLVKIVVLFVILFLISAHAFARYPSESATTIL